MIAASKSRFKWLPHSRILFSVFLYTFLEKARSTDIATIMARVLILGSPVTFVLKTIVKALVLRELSEVAYRY